MTRSSMPTFEHTPVLAGEIADFARGHRRIVDATAGAGGHLAGFLELGAQVLAVDRDPDAIAAVRARFGERVHEYLYAPYDATSTLEAIARFTPDFILLDLGVSSYQLDAADRGFTFREGAPLDMRMSQAGETAADVLNRYPVAELHRLFRDFGDERRARSLAREIDRRSQTAPFESSDDLVRAIRAALGPRSGPPDFARLFQAVRIEVNHELAGLTRALPSLRDALGHSGLLAVITYHSGEDRIVKHAFRDWGRECICPPRQPVCTCVGQPAGVVRTKHPVRPAETEIAANARARSAKLRIFERRDATQG